MATSKKPVSAPPPSGPQATTPRTVDSGHFTFTVTADFDHVPGRERTTDGPRRPGMAATVVLTWTTTA